MSEKELQFKHSRVCEKHFNDSDFVLSRRICILSWI